MAKSTNTKNTKNTKRTAKTKAAPRKRTAQRGSATPQQMAITGVFGAACAGLGALAYKFFAL